MKRDLLMILSILGISAGAAVASNVGWHRLDWIRQAPTTQTNGSDGGTIVPPPASGQHTEGQEQAVGTAEQPANGLTADQVLQHLRLGTARFIDSRKASEYAEGHLGGAINLPSEAIYEKIDNVLSVVGTEEKVIVYCGGATCDAATHVANALRDDFHFADVTVYTSGWEEIVSCGKFENCLTTGEPN